MGLLDPAASTAKFPTIGASFTGVVDSVTERQATEFGTGAPKTWSDGSPIIEHVITLVQANGDRVTVYAKTEHQRAIRKAVALAGASSFETGSTLTITYASDDPDSKTAIPKKLYEAVYTPPSSSQSHE